MPPVGFEPTVSAGERPQTYALDRAATGTGDQDNAIIQKKKDNSSLQIKDMNIENTRQSLRKVISVVLLNIVVFWLYIYT